MGFPQCCASKWWGTTGGDLQSEGIGAEDPATPLCAFQVVLPEMNFSHY